MDLVDTLIEARRRAGWSQLDLALASGLELADLAAVEAAGDGFIYVMASAAEALGLQLTVVRADGTHHGMYNDRAKPLAAGPGVAVQLERAMDHLAGHRTQAEVYLSVPAWCWAQVVEEIWGGRPGVDDTWMDLPRYKGRSVSVSCEPWRRLSWPGGWQVTLRRTGPVGRWPDELAHAALVPVGLDRAASEVYETLAPTYYQFTTHMADLADLADLVARD